MGEFLFKKRGVLFSILLCVFVMFMLIGCSNQSNGDNGVVGDGEGTGSSEFNLESGIWCAKHNEKFLVLIFKDNKGDICIFENDIFIELFENVYSYKIDKNSVLINDKALKFENERLFLDYNGIEFEFENDIDSKIIPLTCYIKSIDSEINSLPAYCFYNKEEILTKGVLFEKIIYRDIIYSSSKTEINSSINFNEMFAFSEEIKNINVTIEGSQSSKTFLVNNFMLEVEINNILTLPKENLSWKCGEQIVSSKEKIVSIVKGCSFDEDLIFSFFNTLDRADELLTVGIWKYKIGEISSYLKFEENGDSKLVRYENLGFKSVIINKHDLSFVEGQGYFINDIPIKYQNDKILVFMNEKFVEFERTKTLNLLSSTAFYNSDNLDDFIKIELLYDGEKILTQSFDSDNKTYSNLTFSSNRLGDDLTIKDNMYCFNKLTTVEVKFLNNLEEIKSVKVNNYMDKETIFDIAQKPTYENENVGYWSYLDDEFCFNSLYGSLKEDNFSKDVTILWKLNAPKEQLALKNGYWISQSFDYIYLLKFNEEDSAEFYDFNNLAYEQEISNYLKVNYDKVVGYNSLHEGFSLKNSKLEIKINNKIYVFVRTFKSVTFKPLEIIFKTLNNEFLSANGKTLFIDGEIKSLNYWLNGNLIRGSVFYGDREAKSLDLNVDKIYAFADNIVNADLNFINGKNIVSKYSINNFTTEDSFNKIVKFPEDNIFIDGSWRFGVYSVENVIQLYDMIFSSDFYSEYNVVWKKNTNIMKDHCSIGVWTGVGDEGKSYVIKFDAFGNGVLHNYVSEFYSSSQLVECKFIENEGYFNGETNLDYKLDTLTFIVNGFQVIFKRDIISKLTLTECFIKIIDGENVSLNSQNINVIVDSNFMIKTKGLMLNGGKVYLKYFSDILATEQNFNKEKFFAYPEDMIESKIQFIFEDEVLSSFVVHNYLILDEFNKIVTVPKIENAEGKWLFDENEILDGGYSILLGGDFKEIKIVFVKPKPALITEFSHSNRADKTIYYFQFFSDGFAYYGTKDVSGNMIAKQIFQFEIVGDTTSIICKDDDGQNRNYVILSVINEKTESFKIGRAVGDTFLKELFNYTLKDPEFIKLS